MGLYARVPKGVPSRTAWKGDHEVVDEGRHGRGQDITVWAPHQSLRDSFPQGKLDRGSDCRITILPPRGKQVRGSNYPYYSFPPCCHCEPVRTLAWQSPSLDRAGPLITRSAGASFRARETRVLKPPGEASMGQQLPYFLPPREQACGAFLHQTKKDPESE